LLLPCLPIHLGCLDPVGQDADAEEEEEAAETETAADAAEEVEEARQHRACSSLSSSRHR
jgi:hypothetical protein